MSGWQPPGLVADDPAQMWEQKPPGYPALRYEPQWAEALHRLLQAELPGARPLQLIDVCCGTGNPTLGLQLHHGADYAITWSDADPQMLSRLCANAAHHGLALLPEQVPWAGLRAHYGAERFDCALCLGNSLIYADSWRGPFDALRSRRAVREALAQFLALLRPGGRLWVDTTDAAELAADQTLFGQGGWREQPDGEHLVSRDYVVQVERDHGRRRVVNYRHRYHKASGSLVETRGCEFIGLALGHEALMAELRAAGFRDVAPVAGGPWPWPMFVGTRP